jgi:iron complex transport system substrate-binding protein
MRIVSVLPSATEIVDALGHGAELVGRSSECDYPPSVRALPVVMRPRTLDSDRPSREIDERVRLARSRNESLYDLDVELLRKLVPELLVTQNLCSVCSVTEEEVQSACARAGVRPRIVSLAPKNLAEVWESVETVGEAVHDVHRGTELALSLRNRTRPSPSTGHTVAVVEWLDPPILAGLWTPDLIEASGGIPLGPRPSEPGARTSWAELARQAPDLVVVSPCSFTVARTREELGQNPKLVDAIRSVRAPLGTFLADEAYFSRPGPRLAEGTELLRNLLGRQGPAGPMPVEPLFRGPAEREA